MTNARASGWCLPGIALFPELCFYHASEVMIFPNQASKDLFADADGIGSFLVSLSSSLFHPAAPYGSSGQLINQPADTNTAERNLDKTTPSVRCITV